jgi:hypothetical protein
LRLTEFRPDQPDLGWYGVNDAVMGGRSSGGVLIENGVLHFSGAINTDGGGFASIRTQAQAWEFFAQTLARLKVLGDGRRYRLRFFTAEERVTYQCEFATVAGQWTVVELPLAAFYASWRGRRLERAPLRCDDIKAVGFIIADGKDGPFHLQVDWIELGSR